MTLFRLQLIGPFGLFGPDGARIDLPGKKGAAIVAMLAMSRGGERTRGWLQDRLWGSRPAQQAQASLRNELLKLRQKVNGATAALILGEADRIRLDLAQISVDAHNITLRAAGEADADHILPGEFLEGIDIVGEDGFEEWLREQRSAISDALRTRADSGRPDALPDAGPSLPSIASVAFDDRPSLGILPFTNLTNSADNAFLADGLTEELIDAVSRLRWLPVIAASSTFAYREPATDRRSIGNALGVRYLLDGRLSGGAGDFVLALSLTDARNCRIIWSQRLQLPSILSRATTMTLVRELVGALDTGIDFAEQEQALAKRPEDLTVTEMIWRARWHINRLTRDDAVLAKQLIDKALAAQPTSSDALIQATYADAWSIWSRRESEAHIKRMRKLAQRAIAADPLDGRGHMLAGMAETWLRKPTQAQLLFEQAIALNPSFSHAHAMLGSSRYLNDDAGHAIAPLETALRLSPHDGQIFRMYGELAMAHHMLGNWDLAIDLADRSLIHRPGYWYAHAVRVNALLEKGETASAREARAELQETKTGFSVEQIDWLPFVATAWPERLKEGLRRTA